MISDSIKKRIQKESFYSPRQVAINGFIKNSRGLKHSYDYILREIKRGRLVAINMNNKGEVARFRIKSEELVNYLQIYG